MPSIYKPTAAALKSHCKDQDCGTFNPDDTAQFSGSEILTEDEDSARLSSSSNLKRTRKRVVAIIGGFTVLVALVMFVLLRDKACAGCEEQQQVRRNDNEAGEQVNGSNDSILKVDNTGIYYNVGGTTATKGGLWERSDDAILHADHAQSDAQAVTLCNDVQSMLCTGRIGHLVYQFDEYEDESSMYIHLYFVRDEKIRRFSIYVDGKYIQEEWTRSREESMFILTVPMGRELELKPIGGPPLLTGIVLSSRVIPPMEYSVAPSASPPTTTTTTSPVSIPRKSSSSAAPNSVPVTYVPGDLFDHPSGLQLSRGLTVRVLAMSNHSVAYRNGERSKVPFHRLPDGGATFPTDDGGWIYVSNSEAEHRNCTTPGATDIECPRGGVGALRFDPDGQIINYELLIGNTIRNCGGGTTPWGAWISGEEVKTIGRIWQVDPTGARPAQPLPMGDVHSGLFESFAYDVRDRSKPRFFMTQDAERGALRRFTPNNPNWNDPWGILLGNGTVEFLVLNSSSKDAGSFKWTDDFEAAATTAFDFFPNTEGIDVVGNELMFVSKKRKSLFILDLDKNTYHNITTKSGLLNGQPDQLERIFEVQSQTNQLTYFTEEAVVAGIHARTPDGKFMTILESVNHSDETTGLSFSPNGKYLYFAYQEEGVLFEVKREDGLPFNARVLDVRYHDVKVR